MSRARHMKRAEGGKVEPAVKSVAYNAKGSEVENEAEEKKRGGRTHVDGGQHKPKKHRLDRPGRKRGGRAGADMHPLSSASKIHNATEHKTTDTGNAEDGP